MMGRVKTRLARDIGPVRATLLYRRMTEQLVRAVGRDPRWRIRLAVTPDKAVRGRFWPAGLRRQGQGDGDLGARMLRAIAAAGTGPVVIVGSDIPDLRRHHIAAAFAALKGHDAVFGPAEDGGYWLIGFRHRGLAPGSFAGVRWSTRHALADSVAALRPGLRVARLCTLRDLDTGADLRALGISAP